MQSLPWCWTEAALAAVEQAVLERLPRGSREMIEEHNHDLPLAKSRAALRTMLSWLLQFQAKTSH